MHTSLTILIILTVVVLIVILMTSPSCKSAVGAMLGQKKVNQPVKASKTPAPAKPSIRSLPKPSGQDMKAAASALKSKVRTGATQLNTQLPAGPQAVKLEKPKTSVMSDPKYPVLNGSVLDLFNSTMDVQSEFGLTEEQIDALAQDFKETHLDAKKDEVTRHRSIIRSQLEEADAKLREGYQTRLTSGKKPNTEETIISMRQERLDLGEDLTERKKPAAKMSIVPRK
jgi:hypothetical protein